MDENFGEIENKDELSLITKGAGIFSFGYIFELLAVFITTVFLTRILGVGDFGLYTLGRIVLQIGATVAILGLNGGALKYMSAYLALDDKKKAKGVMIQAIIFPLIFGSIISAGIFFFSSFIANFFGKPELSSVIKVFSFGIPLFALMQSAGVATRSFKTAKYSVLSEKVLKPFLNFLLIMIFYFLGYRLLGMALALVISIFITVFYLIFWIRKIFPELFSRNIIPEFETKKLLSTSFPLMLIWMIGFFLSWTDTIMIGYFLSSDMVGIYQVAVKVSFLIIMFLGALSAIFVPVISSLYHKGEMKKLSSIFKTVTKWGLFLGLLLFLIFIISSKEIMMIFGNNFVLGTSSLLVLCFGQLIHVGMGASASMLMMTGKEKIEFLNDIFVLILDILLNLILIPKFGILGAAIATTICLAILNIARIAEVYLFLRIHPFNINFLKGIFTAFFVFATVFPLKYYFFSDFNYLFNLFLTSFIVLILFFLFLFILKFEEEDRFIFKKIKERLKL